MQKKKHEVTSDSCFVQMAANLPSVESPLKCTEKKKKKTFSVQLACSNWAAGWEDVPLDEGAQRRLAGYVLVVRIEMSLGALYLIIKQISTGSISRQQRLIRLFDAQSDLSFLPDALLWRDISSNGRSDIHYTSRKHAYIHVVLTPLNSKTGIYRGIH